MHKQKDINDKKYQNIDYFINLLESECNVYVIFEVTDVKNQQLVLDSLKSDILPSFNKFHRILFYENKISKIAFIRQIKPILHIEYDKYIYDNLKPHINLILLLSDNHDFNDINEIKVKNINNYNFVDSIDNIFKIDLN